MRLRSVFKMRISILNTATTEQMEYGIFSFFVYTKSTNSYLMPSSGSAMSSSSSDFSSATAAFTRSFRSGHMGMQEDILLFIHLHATFCVGRLYNSVFSSMSD